MLVDVPEDTRIRLRGNPGALADLTPGRPIRVISEQLAELNAAHSIDVLPERVE